MDNNLPIEEALRQNGLSDHPPVSFTQEEVDAGALLKMEVATKDVQVMGYFLSYEYFHTLTQMDEIYLAIGKTILENDREAFLEITFDKIRHDMLEFCAQEWRDEQC